MIRSQKTGDRRKGRFFLFLLVIIISCQMAANSASQVADLSKLAQGARPMGMAEAFTSVADDASGFMLNPAGLGRVLDPEGMLVHSDLSSVFTVMGFDMAVPLEGVGTLGLSYISQSFGDIPLSDTLDVFGRPIVSGTNLQASSQVFGVALGKKMNPKLNLGILCKAYVQSYDDTPASSLALGVGAIYRLNKFIRLSVTGMNLLSTPFEFSSNEPEEDRLLPFVTVGSALELFEKDFTLAADLRFDEEKSIYHLGTEYWFINMLAFRAGVKNDGITDDFIPSLGVGLRLGIFEVDYCLIYNPSPLTNSSVLSFSLGDARKSEMKRPEIDYIEEELYEDVLIEKDNVIEQDNTIKEDQGIINNEIGAGLQLEEVPE